MITETKAVRILLGVRNGDDTAISELVTTHQNRVYAYALAVVSDPRDAEEVAQDTFVRAIRALRTQYSEVQVVDLAVRSWLLKIARNLALNRIRARKSRLLIVPFENVPEVADLSDPERTVVDGELDRMRTAFGRVDEITREWLTLRFISDLTYAEIAVIRGGTESAARGKVFRSLARLREEFLEDSHAEL
ncbi:MAG: RNA polymerase sigma factor [Chloroflexota bacterium]